MRAVISSAGELTVSVGVWDDDQLVATLGVGYLNSGAYSVSLSIGPDEEAAFDSEVAPKVACRFPLPDGRRCCECDACQGHWGWENWGA